VLPSAYQEQAGHGDPADRARAVEQLRAEVITGQAAIARALTGRGVPTPRGGVASTHYAVARALRRATGAAPAVPAATA
jgi:hypothetical protein